MYMYMYMCIYILYMLCICYITYIIYVMLYYIYYICYTYVILHILYMLCYITYIIYVIHMLYYIYLILSVSIWWLQVVNFFFIWLQVVNVFSLLELEGRWFLRIFFLCRRCNVNQRRAGLWWLLNLLGPQGAHKNKKNYFLLNCTTFVPNYFILFYWLLYFCVPQGCAGLC